MIVLFILPLMALQLWLCFRGKNRFLRMLPFLLGLFTELGSWGAVAACKFWYPDPSMDAAALIFLAVIVGILVMFATGLCWLIYGIMRLAERSKHW